eukprot:5804114-Alexandrium_andersonii.AAC.1
MHSARPVSLCSMMAHTTSVSMSKRFARTAARRPAALRTIQAECASSHWLARANRLLDRAWLLGPTGRSTGLIWLTSL